MLTLAFGHCGRQGRWSVEEHGRQLVGTRDNATDEVTLSENVESRKLAANSLMKCFELVGVSQMV